MKIIESIEGVDPNTEPNAIALFRLNICNIAVFLVD